MKKARTPAKETFLIKKYKYYLAKTINKISNRDALADDFCWKDNGFNQKNKSRNCCDELVIEEKELLSQFLITAKEKNMHEVNPLIFRKALDDMITKLSYFPGMFAFGECPADFYIERQRIANSVLYRIIFGPR